MTDAELAAHLAHIAGTLLLSVREAEMLSGQALGAAGDQTANQFLCHALRHPRPDHPRRQRQTSRRAAPSCGRDRPPRDPASRPRTDPRRHPPRDGILGVCDDSD